MIQSPKPVGSKWSDDQWKAISLTGGHILVAAAAGSGKTAVLVERIIRKISDHSHPLSVDRILVATFTKAAASEMRERIRDALDQQLQHNPQDEHLRRQLAMIGRASITTLHSFCMEVIQRYYTLIPLDPGMRIATESEINLLRQEVLEDLFEEKYGSELEGSAFIRLVDWFSGERTDEAMIALVLKLYDFSRSHPWPDQWLREMAASFEMNDTDSVAGSSWVKSILQDSRLTLDGAYDLLLQAKRLSMAPGGPEPYSITLDADLAMIDQLRSAVIEQSWTSLYDVFQTTLNFGKLKPCRKDQTDPVLQERVKQLRDEAKKMVTELRGQLYGRPAEVFLDELHKSAPLMRELADFVVQFGDRYQSAKVSKGWFDFSDLEHYCLHILRHPDSTKDSVLPSEAALAYQQQFDEVLLDEYQDTNTVQEQIVQLISRNAPGNRFMVGDVKQSIYRFRLAEPGLFLQKYRRYSHNFDGEGARIDLARNFRSRREVIDAVNMLFRQMMNEDIAEIAYDSRAELVYGEGFPAHDEALPDFTPEVLLIDRGVTSSSEDKSGSELGTEDEANDPSAEDALELEAVHLEARAIAARIREMMGETGQRFHVYDKNMKSSRPVEYRDMVILLRSTLTWAPAIIEQLRMEGIPAFGELNQGYFQASEVEIMLSLLNVIDNPQQDIPLASVLRSPLFGFTEEQLAEIRLAKPSGTFYDAVIAAALQDPVADNLADDSPLSTDDSLAYELTRFLNQLESWRNQAREGELSALIWKIYRDTSYLEWVGGLPDGLQRQGNLRALYDRSRQYELSTSSRGLFRFLRYITRLRESGGDLGAVSSSGEQENVVRIMTIHKSKGLEFPVVFVAGLSKNFNRQDLNASFLIHKEMGFGPKFVDEQSRVSYPTLPNLAIRRRTQMELLAEEMRVLYVALTRPKDKLVLVSSVKDLSKAVAIWGQALQSTDEMLPDYMLARGRNYLDWIGPALIRHPAANELRELAGLSHAAVLPWLSGTCDWRIAMFSAGQIAQAAAIGTDLVEGSVQNLASFQALLAGKPVVVPSSTSEDDHANRFVVDSIEAKLNWMYPHEAASHVAAKTTVTEMKALWMEQEVPSADAISLFSSDYENENLVADEEVQYKLYLKRPKFMEQRRMTPTERGTAYHTVMQHLPLQTATTASDVNATLQLLVERQILLPEQIIELDVSRIVGFLESPIGDMLRKADLIRKELPFSYRISAGEAYPRLSPRLNSFHEEESVNTQYTNHQMEHETVLIQGVVDCLFKVNDKLILLDYKSDRVLPHRGGVQALTEQYRFQLELYTQAIEHITGMTVDEEWLYFFDSGDAVKL